MFNATRDLCLRDRDNRTAFSILAQTRQSRKPTIESNLDRIVSGGEYFSTSVIVDDDVVDKIERCCALAPLHNPSALACIALCRQKLPALLQVCVFDTAFHQTIVAAHV